MKIAEYKWKHPTTRTYYYPDGSQIIFSSLISLQVANTGCHTLACTNGTYWIVAPGWRWILQERTPDD